MAERWDEARRLLRQHGVTYNIYGDPQGMERPWPLDMIPLLVPAEEWSGLEAALTQRSRLLNAVLADVYGPQELLRAGLLPAGVLHADPGFRRPLHGAAVPEGLFLHFHGVDLARGPDGRWRVFSDRTQAPSGAGYALENRVVVSRVLPDSFRHCRAERLVPFFNVFRRTLFDLAPLAPDQPRVVLLTPGPYNETYFEHAYLARQLGVAMVEGGDLTIRDRRVYLKTLGGLEPVDVILRRQDDDFCDPLELRHDSALGVAGLVQAVKAGTVAVANALGSGILESPAYQAYLPAVARHLLGEALKLPGLDTWWCGDAAALAHVLANLDRVVIRPAFAALGRDPVDGATLDGGARAAWIERLKRQPWNWVAQERLAPSTAPAWQENRLSPRPLVWRVFLAASRGGYVAMPGGLTRFADQPGRPDISMQKGSGSKDTWVLSPRCLEGRTLIRSTAGETVTGRRTGEPRAVSSDLPSRVADGLFWLGRYGERSEMGLRLLRGAFTRLTDGTTPGAMEELGPILRLMAWIGMIPLDFTHDGDTGASAGRALRLALQAAAFDPDHPNGLRANVLRLHRVAHGVRDRLSLDLWRVISQIDRQSAAPRARPDDAATLERLDDLIVSLAALAGLEQESIVRGPGWRFLDIGRRLERAVNTIGSMRRLRVADADDRDDAALSATLEVLLELGESFMTYRGRYLTTVQRVPVLELLLTDESNPRAVAFQLSSLAGHLAALPLPPAGGGESPTSTALHLIGSARALLRRPDAVRHGPALRQTLDTLADTLPETSNLLAHAYFSHAFVRSA